jgi:hypothetical protein
MVLQLAAIYVAAAAVWLGIKLPVLATIFLLGLAWFLVSKWRSQTRRINASIATLHDEKRWYGGAKSLGDGPFGVPTPGSGPTTPIAAHSNSC